VEIFVRSKKNYRDRKKMSEFVVPRLDANANQWPPTPEQLAAYSSPDPVPVHMLGAYWDHMIRATHELVKTTHAALRSALALWSDKVEVLLESVRGDASHMRFLFTKFFPHDSESVISYYLGGYSHMGEFVRYCTNAIQGAKEVALSTNGYRRIAASDVYNCIRYIFADHYWTPLPELYRTYLGGFADLRDAACDHIARHEDADVRQSSECAIMHSAWDRLLSKVGNSRWDVEHDVLKLYNPEGGYYYIPGPMANASPLHAGLMWLHLAARVNSGSIAVKCAFGIPEVADALKEFFENNINTDVGRKAVDHLMEYCVFGSVQPVRNVEIVYMLSDMWLHNHGGANSQVQGCHTREIIRLCRDIMQGRAVPELNSLQYLAI